MPVSERTYEQLALEDPEGQWELVCGRPRRKPPMTQEHNTVTRHLAFLLQRQLDFAKFEVSPNLSRTRRSTQSYYIPDLIVIPKSLKKPRSSVPGGLESYDAPLPLVVEVWSPSTGEYDVDEKLPEYRERGDFEIWRVHPYEKTLIAWRRQPDGSYTESGYSDGIVEVESLPGVTIDLDELFS